MKRFFLIIFMIFSVKLERNTLFCSENNEIDNYSRPNPNREYFNRTEETNKEKEDGKLSEHSHKREEEKKDELMNYPNSENYTPHNSDHSHNRKEEREKDREKHPLAKDNRTPKKVGGWQSHPASPPNTAKNINRR